jgi:precorrin-3B synthase
MTSPTALDACPGVLALHPARDGHVARIRLPGGYASGPRWRALARLARDFGDGCLDVTARGNVQLRGVRADGADALARHAADAGLLPSAAHDRARNIMASPLAGLGGRAPLRHLVGSLDSVLLGDPVFAALPGRFLFSVDDGTGGSGLAGCDVGLCRVSDGVDVVVAGRTTGVRVPVRAAVPAAAAVTRAALAAGVGTAVTRIADLPDGGTSVAAAIGGALGPPAAVADARLPLGPIDHDSAAGNSAAGNSASRDGTAPHRTRLPDETMIVAAPLGRLSGGQIELIAALLRPREIVRLSIAGRLVIPLAALAGGAPAGGGPAGAGPSEAAAARLAAAGLAVSGQDPRAGVTACSGTACSRAVADVRAVAGPVPGHPRTHWVGCPRQCGCPPDAEPVIAVDSAHFLIPGQAGPQPLVTLVRAS